MQLDQLLRKIQAINVTGDTKDIEIENIRTDSRKVDKGDLFISLRGKNEDGHEHIIEACQNGAVAIVRMDEPEAEEYYKIPQIYVEDTRVAYAYMSSVFYGEPQKKLKIIGVTGTNGKTTTCHLLASILRSAGYSVGVIGTIGIYYNDHVYTTDLTTPDPDRLFYIFSDMEKKGVEYVVMEVSAHSIYYKKVIPIEFIACIFTNCTQDHLDFFENMATYSSVKEKLFSDFMCQKAIVNADDSTGKRIIENLRTQGREVYPITFDDICLEEYNVTGSKFLLRSKSGEKEYIIRLAGKYNVLNATGAIVCAETLGVSPERIQDGLVQVKSVEGRLEYCGSLRGGDIFVDFAHTPDALENTLKTMKEFCTGRLLCVFGCGGNRDEEKRPIMGSIAAKYAYFSVLTSDNPRYEEPYSIISAIEKGYGKFSGNYVVVQDRRKAIYYAARLMRTGDVLVVAGKGAEEYQEIMGTKYDYSDKQVVLDAIREIEAERS